jgi:hypothetical protein
MNKPHKIVVFDLDETLGYFTEFGIFCDCLNNYFKNNDYSEQNFNELLDLYPLFLRPKILSILQYLKRKKKENKCYKVMIYTNNQGDRSWVNNIKSFFEFKIGSKKDDLLFDKIIAAFKVDGKHVELGRTSHDKTMDDFIRCTKMPMNIELCFIDDVYHDGMADDKVYYVNVKPYKYQLTIDEMINTFLSSKLGKIVVNKEHFKQIIRANFNSYSYRLVKKTKEEQDIDEIIGKRILQHLKKFFYEKTNKTYKKRGRGIGNRTMKRTSK